MLHWTRLENWTDVPPKFVELAIDGPALWTRRGVAKVGRHPVVERTTFESASDAERALVAELAKLRRKKFDEEKKFAGAPPTARDLAWRADAALTRGSSRWSTAEARDKKRAFFDRVRAAGIDPDEPFTAQASPGERRGGDAGTALDRDADARASTCLAIAKTVLGVDLRLTGQEVHDGARLRNVFPSAAKIFERARRL